MRNEPVMVFDPSPGAELAELVQDNVENYTIALTGAGEWHPVNYFLKGSDGACLGGCTGGVWGSWLHVRWLFVSAATRSKGQGARLLAAAETMGRGLGAIGATLETHNPQALVFYQRHGYVVFGRLEDYPPGHTKYFMKKSLVT